MSGFQGKVNFIWSVADEILRDDFKRSKYPDVILPFTVLRAKGLLPYETRNTNDARSEPVSSRAVLSA